MAAIHRFHCTAINEQYIYVCLVKGVLNYQSSKRAYNLYCNLQSLVLLEHIPAFGSWYTLSSTSIAEVIIHVGLDWNANKQWDNWSAKKKLFSICHQNWYGWQLCMFLMTKYVQGLYSDSCTSLLWRPGNLLCPKIKWIVNSLATSLLRLFLCNKDPSHVNIRMDKILDFVVLVTLWHSSLNNIAIPWNY